MIDDGPPSRADSQVSRRAPSTVCPVTDADPAMLAAVTLASATGVPSHDVAVVMGSGWQSAADALGVPIAEVDLARIPGFAVPTSVGHPVPTGTR